MSLAFQRPLSGATTSASRKTAVAARSPIPTIGGEVSDVAFRNAMRRVISAVHVITSDGAEGRAGLTASAVVSVSDRPPTILVCLNGSSSSGARLVANGVFCVNTLSPEDEAIAATFSGRTELPQHRRFERGQWDSLATGSPTLASAVAIFDCRLTDVRRVATHDVVLGEVLAVRHREDAGGLAYLDGRYLAV